MATKKRSRRAAAIILAVLVFLYVIYQIHLLTASAVKAESSVNYTAYKTVSVDAFAIRDESLLYSDESGFEVNSVEDGTRVTYSTVVKRIFKNENDARSYQELMRLNKELNYYESVYLQKRVMNIDRNTNDGNLSSAYADALEEIRDNDYISAFESIENMRLYITNRQILTGEDIEVEEKISSLRERCGNLSANISSVEVNPDAVGYYCGTVDGYENTLSYDVDSLTMADIKKALESPASAIPSNAVGKINRGFVWYFACIVSASDISGFSSGNDIEVRLPLTDVDTIKMTVYSIENADAENCVLILKSQTMNSDIANLRKERLELIIEEHSGIRINPQALRTDSEGNLGVYVLVGNLIRFRAVNCLYATDEYIIVEGNDKTKYLKLENYDSVIYEGKDLYDGRII